MAREADQKDLHNSEEETEMDEKMQTQNYVRILPHTGLQIPLERFKETRESNTEWKFSSSTCHPLTLIPNSESPHGYRQLRWYTVLMAASLITCFPFPSRPKERFPWATDKRHNTRTTAVSQPKGPFSSIHCLRLWQSPPKTGNTGRGVQLSFSQNSFPTSSVLSLPARN